MNQVNKVTARNLRGAARELGMVGGFVWICQNCEDRARKIHGEKWARRVAALHCIKTGHTVRVYDFK